jgi:ribosome-associated heat shock protein Hsp15
MRLDKWLWAARFFKTRQIAIDAINGGKVQVNGQRTKPGKEISVGSTIAIGKDQLTWEVEVAALSSQRRPAAEAVLLYAETEASRQQRQDEVARRREERELGIEESVRPTKRQRRLIHRFKREITS